MNMETSDIHDLIRKFNDGSAGPSEISRLEKLLEEGSVDLHQFPELMQLDDQLLTANEPEPTGALDEKFHAMLSAEKRKVNRFTFSLHLPPLSVLLPRLAYTVALMICGFLGGYWLNKPAPASEQVQALSKQVDNLQEMVMLSLLEKESASERLRAVSLTSEMDQASKKVTTALLQTLNNDSNVNVRLAALDALRPYVRDNSVRTALVKSISRQESPMVQVALAELMRDIQEKRSVSEFNKILSGGKTPDEVKRSIREKIQVLI
jgi:HEAT repeats